MKHIDTLPLVQALWWFIENGGDSELFFHLRERVRSQPTAVTVTLPGLEPHAAKDLVNMALQEWRHLRETPNYVGQRYAHMDAAFRERRRERLKQELAALEQCEISIP